MKKKKKRTQEQILAKLARRERKLARREKRSSGQWSHVSAESKTRPHHIKKKGKKPISDRDFWDVERELQSASLTTILKTMLQQAESLHTPELATMPYSDFMRTMYWTLVKRVKRALVGGKCEKCNSKNDLHTHHLTYSYRGNEHKYLSCLQVLCAPCHRETHKIM